MAREWEKENHPEWGALLYCSHFLVREIPATHCWARIPQAAAHVAQTGRAAVTACDVTTLLPNSRFQLLPDIHHCPPASSGVMDVTEPPLSTSQIRGNVIKPPLSTSQLRGNVTKPALSPATWPKSPEMQQDKDKTSLKCQLSTTRHSSPSTCDSKNPVHGWHRPPPGHARQFSS